MTQDAVKTPLKDKLQSANWRLMQAIDILIDYMVQLDGNGLPDASQPEDQVTEPLLFEGGSRSASKSDRRILLPPPDLSS